jgi:hypothetical protein
MGFFIFILPFPWEINGFSREAECVRSGNPISGAIQNRSQRAGARFSSCLECYLGNFPSFTLQIESNCYDPARKVAFLQNDARSPVDFPKFISSRQKSAFPCNRLRLWHLIPTHSLSNSICQKFPFLCVSIPFSFGSAALRGLPLAKRDTNFINRIP